MHHEVGEVAGEALVIVVVEVLVIVAVEVLEVTEALEVAGAQVLAVAVVAVVEDSGEVVVVSEGHDMAFVY